MGDFFREGGIMKSEFRWFIIAHKFTFLVFLAAFVIWSTDEVIRFLIARIFH